MPDEKEKSETIEALLKTIGNKDPALGRVLTHFHEELKRKQEKPDGGGGVTMTI